MRWFQKIIFRFIGQLNSWVLITRLQRLSCVNIADKASSSAAKLRRINLLLLRTPCLSLLALKVVLTSSSRRQNKMMKGLWLTLQFKKRKKHAWILIAMDFFMGYWQLIFWLNPISTSPYYDSFILYFPSLVAVYHVLNNIHEMASSFGSSLPFEPNRELSFSMQNK